MPITTRADGAILSSFTPGPRRMKTWRYFHNIQPSNPTSRAAAQIAKTCIRISTQSPDHLIDDFRGFGTLSVTVCTLNASSAFTSRMTSAGGSGSAPWTEKPIMKNESITTAVFPKRCASRLNASSTSQPSIHVRLLM